MSYLDHIVLLDEGVPFGNKYGIFYDTDGNSECFYYGDSLKQIEKLAKNNNLKKSDNIFEKLNITLKNLYKLENKDEHTFSRRNDLRDKIYECNERSKKAYDKLAFDLGLYKLTNMYYFDSDDVKQIDRKTYKEYKKIRKQILKECKSSGIKYEKDDDVIINKVIEEYKKYDQDKTNIDECYSVDSICHKFNSHEGNIKELNEENYLAKKRKMIDYTANHFQNDHRIAQALCDKYLIDRNDILKDWAEFLIALPKYCTILSYLEKCEEKIYEIEKWKAIEVFNKDKEFMASLEEVMKPNKDKDLYFHATYSSNIDSILENGLFLGSSELESTAISGLNTNGVLSYSYGDGYLGEADECVVIMEKDKNENIVRKATIEEKEKCKPFSRRFLIATPLNDYVIDKKYIVGVVDKKKKIVYNNKQCLEMNEMFENNINEGKSESNEKKK